MTIPPAADAAPSTKPPLLPPPAPLDGFSAGEFAARRAALRKAVSDGVILIRGAAESDLPHNLPLRYRQDSAFFYLTGVDTPGAFLVLLPDGLSAAIGLRGAKPEARQILFLPARDASAEQWTGAKLGPDESTQQLLGVDHAADSAKLFPALAHWIRRCPLVQTLAPFGEQSAGSPAAAMMRRVSDVAPVAKWGDLSTPLAELRLVKSAAEIDRIRQAVAITDAGHRAARAIIAGGAGRREYEVEAAVFAAFRAAGATLGFSSIVGSGVNGAVLHYGDNNAVMRQGDLVVVDIGAQVGHYNGDVTRTYPVGGSFGDRQREIYELVLACHAHAVSEFEPGVDSLHTMNERAKAFFKASVVRAKDVGGAMATMDSFFPHSLGHHLGLDVHDVADAADRFTPLPIDSVITIEPGLYLPAEGVGVRIEDDFQVTANGLRRIGHPLEATVAELEAAMGRAS